MPRHIIWGIFDALDGTLIAEADGFVTDPETAQLAAEITAKQLWLQNTKV